MQMLRHSEIERLVKRFEAAKAKRFDPLAQFKVIPSPIELGEAFLGFELDVWQRDYMLSAPAMARIAIAASRQSGKSTVTAIFVAWCLLFIPGFTCLVASRSLRQASYYVDKVREIVLSVVPKDAMRSLNRLTMELPNGSTIISIPCAQPDAGRGFSPHLVLLDEAAFAPEALFTAIMPSVAATHGAIHMISSPNGRQGRFFEAHEGKAKDVWWTKRITYKDCPRMTDEQMEIERIAMGDLYWRQEFMSEFVQPLGAFFGNTSLLAFEEEEEIDFTGMDLKDLDGLADDMLPSVDPSIDDVRAAMDVAQRTSRLLYE